MVCYFNGIFYSSPSHRSNRIGVSLFTCSIFPTFVSRASDLRVFFLKWGRKEGEKWFDRGGVYLVRCLLGVWNVFLMGLCVGFDMRKDSRQNFHQDSFEEFTDRPAFLPPPHHHVQTSLTNHPNLQRAKNFIQSQQRSNRDRLESLEEKHFFCSSTHWSARRTETRRI